MHRLIANKADGKLVELPSQGDQETPTSDMVSKEKMDRMAMDFGNLLTTQLESQRTYFQEEIAGLEATVREQAAEVKRLTALNERLASDMHAATERMEASEHDRKLVEKRAAQLSQKYAAALKDLSDERAVGASLASNQTTLEAQLAEKNAQVTDLQEQLRDVMFYLETQQRVDASEHKEEIQGGTVIMEAGSPAPSSKRGSPGKKKR